MDGEAIATVQRDLDQRVEQARGRAAIDADSTIILPVGEPTPEEDLAATAAELESSCPR